MNTNGVNWQKMNDHLKITEEYLNNILPEQALWEKELIAYAKDHRVPIIEPISMNFISTLIKTIKPKNILEVGTAIGYSALSMHYACPDAKITTLERNQEMINKATENISKYSLNDHIKLITGDALLTLPELIKKNETFDFIFIDAAKGQYQSFFESAMKLQNNSGVILTDNVLFKGYVAGKLTNHKRFQNLGKKIDSYNKWLMKNEKYNTSIIPIGDGIAFSIKK